MRAAVYHARGDIRIEEAPDATCAAGELLLEVHAVGICGTDAHEFAAGPRMFPIEHRHAVTGHQGPMIPGHEITGVVREVGAGVVGFAEGDLVVSGAGISCGECVQCRRQRTNLCVQYATVGLQRDGGLAQLAAVPAAICIRVEPYGITQDAAALAQPMAIAVHAMRRGRLSSSDSAVVVGAGGIGGFLTFAASTIAEKVVVLDLDDDRLRIAAGLGASHTLAATDAIDPRVALREWGVETTVVYEVSGTAAGLQTAISILPPGGRLVLVGLQGRSAELDVRTLSLVEHELIGTNAHVCGDDLPTALELIAKRSDSWSDVAPVAVSLDDLVEKGLRPIVERRSSRIKTLVDPWTVQTRPTLMRNDS